MTEGNSKENSSNSAKAEMNHGIDIDIQIKPISQKSSNSEKPNSVEGTSRKCEKKSISTKSITTPSLYSRPGWQLFAICYLVGVQSSLTTGFVNSCYSTIEKIFNFNSKFTGLIEGSFHVAIVLLVIPVSFYGRKGNKPLIMATGAALIAVGAFCYSSAEFFRDRPFSVLNITVANSGQTLVDGRGCTDSLDGKGGEVAWPKWLFVTGMFLIGVGSTPIQTVAIAYLDQNHDKEGNTGWSLGWFHAVGLLAPACGFVLSGSFLSMPIDFSSWAMPKEDASFMGAWWIGFMLECALALVLVPILLTLPKSNKIDEESAEVAEDPPVEEMKSHLPPVIIQDSATSRKEEFTEFKTIISCLMRDKTFICLLLHGSVLHLTTAGLTAFMPKFFETQYRMIAQIAAFVAGGVSVPAAAIGAIISGYVIKRLKLTCLGTIKMTFFAQGSCIILCAIFFIIRCPYGEIYGSDDLVRLAEETHINVTNEYCAKDEMRISCLNNEYNVYSPCVLQCHRNRDCSAHNTTITAGFCEKECYWRAPAFMLFFITFLVASMVAVPRIFALLRLVEDEWKTISLGVQWVFFRLLGMIPGPLLYGQIFDSSCTQWGSFSLTCTNGVATGSSHCSFYNSTTLRNYMMAVTVGSLIIGQICLFFAIYFYQKEHVGPGKKGYICANPDAIETKRICQETTIGVNGGESGEGSEPPPTIRVLQETET